MTTFPAGHGAAWLDLLATLKGRYRPSQVDAIDSPATLRAWLREQGLEPSGPVTAADVELVQNAREALHRTTVAAVHEQGPRAADVRLLESTLQADRTIRVRRSSTGLSVGRPASVAEALARLTRAATQDLSAPHHTRLRACGDETCAAFFTDPTGRRRWCSDERCGNRMRVRAHRARAVDA